MGVQAKKVKEKLKPYRKKGKGLSQTGRLFNCTLASRIQKVKSFGGKLKTCLTLIEEMNRLASMRISESAIVARFWAEKGGRVLTISPYF